MIGITLPDQIS